MAPEELIIKIVNILNDLKIPYAITGGFAIVVWGRPRYTADVDIIVEMAEKNIKPLASRLLEIDKNVYVDEDTMREALQYKSEFNFIEPDMGLKVDFFVKDNTPYNKLKIKRAIAKDIFGQEILFVSPEDLILSKMSWAKDSESQKQFEDIRTVLRNKKIKLDLKYIRGWAVKQETIEIFERLLKEIKN